jgi:hypothetical protein
MRLSEGDRTYTSHVVRAWFTEVQEQDDGAILTSPYCSEVRPLVYQLRGIGWDRFPECKLL